VVALRMAIDELASREFVRDEIRDQLRENSDRLIEELRKDKAAKPAKAATPTKPAAKKSK
jgi:hypothetical protein